MSLKVYMFYRKTTCKVKKFIDDELGVSPIVATVLIILVTVILAVLVSDGLKAWVNELFTRFRTNSGNIK